MMLFLQGIQATVESDVLQFWKREDPASYFQSLLQCLVILALAFKALDMYLSYEPSAAADGVEQQVKKPASIVRLERKYLSVFWLIRTAFWMSGPYYYSALASKTTNGEKISVTTISQIVLTGYVATPMFGGIASIFLRKKGPRVGSIIAVILYAVGALSLCSNSLAVLFIGRGLGGIGTSMISSAPEAWLVSEAKSKDKESAEMWLPGIFGRAFQFDPILAVLAGRLAGFFADRRGPTGPFQASPFILGVAMISIVLFWTSSSPSSASDKTSSVKAKPEPEKETLLRLFNGTVLKDTNILLGGCIQVFFEAAMNVFVMLWPRTMDAAVKGAFGVSTVTPYGAIFSCMMASCLVGGRFFGELSRIIGFESTMFSIMSCATLSMGYATYLVANDDVISGGEYLWQIIVAFLVFEACVGAYFPSIGVLRCTHCPETNLSMIITLFQLPTNAIVATIFFFFQSLGSMRAFLLVSTLLSVGAACMVILCLRERGSQAILAEQKETLYAKQALVTEKFRKAVHEAKLEHRGLASRRHSDSIVVHDQSALFPRSSRGLPANLEQRRGLARRRHSDSLVLRGHCGIFPRSSLGVPI
eukprot:scaffold1443_cov113-Cylindrotheca_fusiformis.AAC.1